LTGSNASDSFTFGAAGTLSGIIDGVAGVNDEINYAALASAVLDITSLINIDRVIGNGSNFTLVNGNIYTITGADAGTVDGIAFTDWANLTGSGANDRFVFSAAGSVSGVMDGGAGANDEVSYAALANKALDVTSLTNIERVTGGNNGFTLVGGTAYMITGADTGVVDGITFTGWANLTGSSGNDSFTFGTGGSLSGVIDGDVGADDEINYAALAGKTLDITSLTNIERITGNGGNFTLVNGSTYTITGANVGTVDGIAFIGWANLIGSSGNDSFTFGAAGSLSGEIDGVGGTGDSVNYSALAAVTADVTSFNGIESLIGGGSGFVLTEGTAYTITGADAGTVDGIAFTGWANLIGSSANDSFTFGTAGTLSGVIDGAAGSDDEINYAALAGKTLDITTLTNIERVTGGGGGFTLVGGTVYTIAGADTGTVDGIVFADWANLTGSEGDDSFTFGAAGSLSGFIDGAASTNDEINYSALASKTLDISNLTNIERVAGGNSGFTLVGGTVYAVTGADAGTVDGIAFTGWANLTGSSGDDSFTFGAAGMLSGVIDGANGGSDTINYASIAGAFNLDLAAPGFIGIDEVIGGGNAFTISNGRAFNLTGNNSGTVDGISFINWANLVGSAAADTFVLSGGTLDGGIDGGLGDDTLFGVDGRNHSFVFANIDSALVDGINVTAVENYRGGSGNDTFTIDSIVNANIDGGAGNDSFVIGGSAVVSALSGGADTDVVSFVGDESNWDFSAANPSINGIELQLMELFEDKAVVAMNVIATKGASIDAGLINFDNGLALSYLSAGDLSLRGSSLDIDSLERGGDISLIADAITVRGNLSGQNLAVVTTGDVFLSDVAATTAVLDVGGQLEVAQLNTGSLSIVDAAHVMLGSITSGVVGVNSRGGVVAQSLVATDLDITAAGDVALNTSTQGVVNISSVFGNVALIESGDLRVGNISATGNSSQISVQAQGDIVFDTVGTQSRSSGSVLIRSERGSIYADRELDEALRGDVDIVAGQIAVESAFGEVGRFNRPIVLDSVGSSEVLNARPFVNARGGTPKVNVSGGVLGSSALDVASSSSLNSAVQALIDTLVEVDPGVFKDDRLVELDDDALALPQSQQSE
ncbi:MAG: hypothetical protein WCY88_10600, partial [Spongiibacteraceae bacterium]